MKHRLFTFLLAVMASASMSFAETYSGSCGEDLTWSLNTEDSVLTISGTGLMESFNNISDPWYVHRTAIKSAIIGSGVTSIGNSAFYGCSGLTSVTIGNSVTSIGFLAFENCTALTSVTIPNSVTSIGGGAFLNCTGLTSVTIGNSVTSIGYGAFLGCSGLTSPVYNAHVFAFMPTSYSGAYTIPDGIEFIAGSAFYNCTGLTSVTIPNSVTSIGKDAFYNCTGLTSVTIPNSVTSIGEYAFYNCSGLTSVTIPNSVTSIGEAAFYNCDGLTSVTIPNSVTSIGKDAFYNCTSLTSVTIPNSVTRIGDHAFVGCTSLTSPVYNAHVFAFMPTSYSGAYTIPDGIESIVGGAFRNCTGLTSVTIPNSITSIGDWAFGNCSGLTSVTIPNSVTSIGDGAFKYCTGLTSITNYAIEPQTINSNVFTNVDKSACTLYVPAESVETYQAADVWKDFGNILPIEDTPEVNDTLTIAEAIQIGMALDSMATSAETYTIEGYVINAGTFPAGAKYQNWYMADDQETASSDFQAYRCYPIDGIDTVEVRNGSKVRMTGHLQKYYDRQKALYVVEMTYTPAIILSKPQIDTITVAEALAIGAELAENANTAKQYVIRGYVSSVTTPFSAQNGDQNFYIADDSLSTASSNAEGGFYVYRGKPITGQPIKEGALVELTTAIKNYNNRTIENAEQNVPVTVIQEGTCRIYSGTCGAQGDNITWIFNKCDGILTISGTGAMDDYTSYSATPWYSNRAFIKFVIIEDGVTSIGSHAFDGCSGLTSVTIPNSVTSIGDGAFKYCIGVTSVTIPNSVTSIGNEAFYYCTGLTSVTNYSITPQTINANAFASVNLSSCTLYVPAESLAAYQAADVWKDFGNILPIEGTEESNYASLADIYNMAADSVFTLGAFDVVYVASYQNGANMYIKDASGSGVIYMPSYGLQAGDHVEAGLQGKVHIYNGLYEITPISTKEELTITSGEAPAPMEATEAPSLANVNQYVVYKGVSFSTDTSFVEGRRHMVYGTWNGQEIAFYNQYHIGATLSTDKTYNITAVNSVYGTALQVYPLAVEEVDSVPDLCVIASGTCGAEGDNLTWALTCDSVLTISGTGAMADYNSDDSAPWYSNNEVIRSVIIENSVTSIGDYAFYPGSGLTSVTIPNSVTQIGLGAFYGCNLTSLAIPNSVITIKRSAFRYCRALTSVSIPSSVQTIGSDAFEYCDNLVTANISSSVTSIGNSAFAGCKQLQSINVDEANLYFCSIDGVLFNKDQTKFLQYPNGKGDTLYIIPNTVTTLGSMSFSYILKKDSVKLTSIVIPSSVTTINANAFWNANNLASITNYAVTPQWVSAPYANISSCTLYVPAQSLEAYQAADFWKDFANILPIEGTDEPVETVEGNYTIYYMDKDSQDLTDETVTLHVPVAPVIDGFTFVEWRVVEGSLSLGITIQAVYEANEPTSAPAVYTKPTNPAQKLIRNGNVYILTDDKIYSITGQTVR